MNKKSTPTERAARMLDLVPFIASHQGIAFEDLAKEFSITESELTSDLNALWMCGDNRFDLIDLEFESGFVTIRNADTLNMVRSLSSQEIVSILLGLDLIAKELPNNRHDLQSTIDSLKEKLGNGLEQVVTATPTASSEYFAILQSALLSSKKVLIGYYNATEDQHTSRTVTPLDIFQSGAHDFMLAFCELAQAQRTFRIDRIQSAQILDESAVAGKSSQLSGDTISAKISIRANLRKSSETLRVKVSNLNTSISLQTFSQSWLVRTLIASGGAMVLHEPESAREEIITRAKSALHLYD